MCKLDDNPKQHRCPKCGKLLAVEKKNNLEILCTRRGISTKGEKCNTITKIPLKNQQ